VRLWLGRTATEGAIGAGSVGLRFRRGAAALAAEGDGMRVLGGPHWATLTARLNWPRS